MTLYLNSRWRTAILLGALTSLLQLMLCFIGNRHDQWSDAYRSFSNWDGQWYAHIVRNGYLSTIPPVQWNPDLSNVAFFPGLPIWAWLFSKGASLEASTALVVSSQVAALFFWVFFYFLCARWNLSLFSMILLGLLIFIHPAAFFLQMGYSESLFMASLLGLIVALSSQHRWRFWLAASFGIVMTGTRIVGAPLGFIGTVAPLVLAVQNPQFIRRIRRPFSQRLCIGILSLLGVGTFLIYCGIRWGHPDLYMWTQEVGWRIQPNYAAVLDWRTWSQWSQGALTERLLDPMTISRLSTSLYLWLLLSTLLLEVFAARSGIGGFRKRAPFYAASSLMMFVAIAGLASVHFQSMIRYTFPVHVCWLLGISGLFQNSARLHWTTYAVVLLIFLAMSFYALALQVRFIYLFTGFQWVA